MSFVPNLRGLPAAVVFLTRIPVPGSFSEEDFRAASGFFAWVGFLVGAVAALASFLTKPLGPFVSACIAVSLAMVLTGAMHEDGLADTADALFGTRDRERAFQILKDPRLGAFGVASLVMVLLARVASLASAGSDGPLGLILAHTLSRLAATVALATLPYVTPASEARSTSVVGTKTEDVLVGAAFVACLLGLALVLHALDPRALVAVIASGALVTFALVSWFRARLGGVTGDLLGALVQLVDLAVWLALLATGP